MYISSDTAKAAVEKFWLIQDRTLIEHEQWYERTFRKT
jgi:hypothetical protein